MRTIVLVALTAACTSYVNDPTRNLSAAASVYVAPDDAHVIVAVLSLENTGPSPFEIVWSSDCAGNGPVRVRAYRSAGSVSSLVWDSARLPVVACPTAIHRDTILPGALKSFQKRVAMSAILGDSLSAGTYRFTVLSALFAPTLSDEVDVGTLDLIATPVP
jgi:hypothetical protein